LPLRLTLRPNEKLFLNGAVVVNGDARTDLTLLNDVSVLREKDIMTEEAADTVCKRIYFLVQLIYIDPANLADYRAKLGTLMLEVAQAAPGARPQLEEIDALVSQGGYYQAMKVARKLISTEKEWLENAIKTN
jgi:flagellar protein FlbT